MTAMLLYIVAWSKPINIPLYQSFFYGLFLAGKVISSAIFALAMRSASAQVIFFMTITALTLFATLGFSIMPNPPPRVMPKPAPIQADAEAATASQPLVTPPAPPKFCDVFSAQFTYTIDAYEDIEANLISRI